MPKPLLSIGMIVKNETRCLKRCLDALAPLRGAVPCELVIADTGSTDGTRELAAEYADVLFDFEWCDDFSAARNAVMDRCAGVWHLQVDADEYLDEDFGQLVDWVKSNPAGRSPMAYVVIRNYLAPDMPADNCADFLACRLVRMDTGYRFRGSIHETIPVPAGLKAAYLTGLVLHHDGYVYYSEDEKYKKNRRNMPLLEAELEKNPNDMRRIIQCMEAAYTPEQMRKYACMAVDAAERAVAAAEGAGVMEAYHMAVKLAGGQKYPELPQWIGRARELLPDSVVLGVDCSKIYAEYWSRRGEHELALEELQRYWEATGRYDRGEYDPAELLSTVAYYAPAAFRQDMLCLQAGAQVKLKRWADAADTLNRLEIRGGFAGIRAGKALNSILEIWRESELDAAALLRRIWDGLALDEGKGAERRRRDFLAQCCGAFRNKAKPGEREVWRLFAALGEDCDLGRAGLLAGEAYPGRARALLEQVEDWRAIPAEAVANALSIGAVLPAGLGKADGEIMQGMAAGVARLWKETPEQILKRWSSVDFGRLDRAAWGFSLAAGMVWNLDWERHGSIELCGFFCERSGEYLKAVHPPALCTEENVNLLPAMSRYAWYCARAWEADRAKDELGCIRMLRTGLKTYPAAKGMVSFMLDAAKDGGLNRQAASRELLALAEQVKTILAQYPAGHPMAEQIKATPAYRQVAHLIEG